MLKPFLSSLFLAVWLTLTGYAQSGTLSFNADTVKAGPFDMGKMWTFDNPPKDYFQKTYGFAPDDKWFEETRLAALRFASYCSASFVSADGLVMTNHHCARESGRNAQRKGEDLSATGFYAKTLAEERKVPDLYVDQLVKMEDITERVVLGMGSGAEEEQLQRREQLFETIKQEYGQKEGWKGLELQTITFYNGGRYSLYGFKRYNDVRLVFMPEQQLGYFGGDYDNFTYPRYNLDCSFFRVYENGKPLKTTHFFKFNIKGVREGDPIFVIGNPGSTERLKTVPELEFDRDLNHPFQIEIFRNRANALTAYNARAKNDSLKNQILSLENSLKAIGGQLTGLRDPYLLARKAAFDRQFQADVRAKNLTDQLKIWESIAANVAEERKYFKEASYFNPSGLIRGELLSFAQIMQIYAQAAALNPARAEQIKGLLEIPNVKFRALEEAFLAAHLAEVQTGLGNDDPYVKAALSDASGKLRTPREAAAYLIQNTQLMNLGFAQDLITKGATAIAGSNDPLLALGRLAAPRFQQAAGQLQNSEQQLELLRASLGRLLYQVYGASIPPDATFSLRINDGTVRSYLYNGTMAPIQTTYAGMYDRYYAFNGKFPWDLPARWKTPPAALLREPMNFITTNDIIGGNSGSPMINRNREAVGLAFDGNMESLPGSFIFVPDRNRTVSVHTSAMIAAMKHIYKADRLINELVGK
ncbi:S46 family peptidase [Tellurirhabdus bombi]|uniref:S46 family peptidase n=1 Tax=Tellurirhabdus bombi TaxID=2907205 RepID=UPI001F40EE64|nr:S46 family peptidase [Tellurirhabdus bombi]